jgi:hypothetical protein
VKVLIAVESCQWHKNHNDWQRKTWVPNVKDADVRFFMAKPETDPLPDEVYLDVEDDYKALASKTKGAVRWALKHDYDFMFKCDTDTYIVPERLLNSNFWETDYTGHFQEATWQFPFGFAAGGPGYWLSTRAMEILAEAKCENKEGEDRWVGRVLGEADIHCVNDPRYTIIMPRDVRLYGPHVSNDVITCCEFPESAMQEPHAVWINSSEKRNDILNLIRIR